MSGKGVKVCNILDIFGFEIFDKNYLEQFCINYANESLQSMFIDFTIKKEKELYKREGVQWTDVSFKVKF